MSFGVSHARDSNIIDDGREFTGEQKITEPIDLASLAKIEETVREQTLKHITPQIGLS